MKRFLLAFGALILISVSVYTFFEYRNVQHHKLLNAHESFGYSFEVMGGLFDKPENLAYLIQAADENNINFLRIVSLHNPAENRNYVENYIYLSTETEWFSKIPLSHGRSLRPSDRNSEVFMSTKDSKDANQIAKIANFGGHQDYSIYNIKKLIRQQALAGTYRAESRSELGFQKFLKRYGELVTSDLKGMDESIIKQVEHTTRNRAPERTDLFGGLVLSLVTLCVLEIFFLVSSTKYISVLKLHGYSTFQILSEILLKDSILVFGLVLLVIGGLTCFIPDSSTDFFKILMRKNLAVTLAVLFVIFLGSFVYVSRTKTVYAMKGKRRLTAVLSLNIVVKVVVMTAIVLTMGRLLSGLDLAQQKRENIHNWKTMSEYGTFYPIYSGDEREAIRSGEYPLDVPFYKLYESLNAKRSVIYADSSEFVHFPSMDTSDNDSFKVMTVNTDYLKVFPIAAPDNQPVFVDPDERNTVVLVPESRKHLVQDIVKEFEEFRTDFESIQTEVYNEPGMPEVKNIKIIPIKDQEVFSLNTQVFPENRNRIHNPIMMVLTPKNTLAADIKFAADQPTVFVPLENMDAIKTYERVSEELRGYSLDDNLPYLVRMQDVLLEEIQTIEQELRLYAMVLGVLTAVAVTVMAQFTYLFIQSDEYELFLKKSMGYPFVKRYSKMYLFVIGSCCFVGIASVAMNIEKMAEIVSSLFLLELGIGAIFVRYFERKSVLTVLKRGL